MLPLVENRSSVPVPEAHLSRLGNRDCAIGTNGPAISPGSAANRDRYGSTWPAWGARGGDSSVPVGDTNREQRATRARSPALGVEAHLSRLVSPTGTGLLSFFFFFYFL